MDGLRAVNVYAIEAADGITLIDAGWVMTEAHNQLSNGLATIGFDLGDVRQCVVTHTHRDHYTLAVALRRLFGFKIALGLLERPALDILINRPFDIAIQQIHELVRCGARELAEEVDASHPLHLDPEHWDWPDTWLADGEIVELSSRRLRVQHTPGHTQGHVMFADDAGGLVFTGDHVLPHITPSIGYEFPVPRLPLGDYLSSLRHLLTSPDAVLLPAHGPVGASVHARVRQLIVHHAQRLDATFACAEDSDGVTAFDVASQLSWTRRRRDLSELDPFNKMLAIFETAAHLDVLVNDDTLTVDRSQGVDLYRGVSAASAGTRR
jgi:glyoxylase-like metal-dependent hydrolase (beta-lactamase superfamily II)